MTTAALTVLHQDFRGSLILPGDAHYEVARKVFLAANRTFNAPIDREDILALGHVLDDAVDLI